MMLSVSDLLAEGQQPVVPLAEREPTAIRAAVARLDPAALATFEADWSPATARTPSPPTPEAPNISLIANLF
jgi:hypothetical protein